jgi:hypothetical protein
MGVLDTLQGITGIGDASGQKIPMPANPNTQAAFQASQQGAYTPDPIQKIPIPGRGAPASSPNAGSLLLDPNARSSVKSGIESMINYNGIGQAPGNYQLGGDPASSVTPSGYPAPTTASGSPVAPSPVDAQYQANKAAFATGNAAPGYVPPELSQTQRTDALRTPLTPAPTTVAPIATVTPDAATPAPGTSTGSGTLSMGGKSVDYSAIGTASDPFNGGTANGVVPGQALNSKDVVDNLVSQREAAGTNSTAPIGSPTDAKAAFQQRYGFTPADYDQHPDYYGNALVQGNAANVSASASMLNAETSQAKAPSEIGHYDALTKTEDALRQGRVNNQISEIDFRTKSLEISAQKNQILQDRVNALIARSQKGDSYDWHGISVSALEAIKVLDKKAELSPLTPEEIQQHAFYTNAYKIAFFRQQKTSYFPGQQVASISSSFGDE